MGTATAADPDGSATGDDQHAHEAAALLPPSGCSASTVLPSADLQAALCATHTRKLAEMRALVLMIAAGALLNGGYGPSESYRTAVFGALGCVRWRLPV